MSEPPPLTPATASHDGARAALAPLRAALVLPPGFSCLTLAPEADAFAEAVARAPDLGAASVVWTPRADLLAFAVVLEPEEPLQTARLAHYMAMNALADMVAVHGPAERPLRFGWPDGLLMDHGLIGGGRLAWPQDCAETETPAWLVFGAMLRLTAPEQGETRDFAAGAGIGLSEIGADTLEPSQMVESFCHHLMLASEEWARKEPKAVVKRWLDRLERKEGLRQGIEPNGDLISRGGDGEARADLVAALHAAHWFDPVRREPRL